MKLGAMQPYFFPYIGYFELIYRTDFWIVFDVSQYIRHGWINRNRVLRSPAGWQYIIVPLKGHSHTTPIADICIAEDGRWRGRLLKQLELYRRAPFFHEVIALVSTCLAGAGDSIAQLNVGSLKAVCAYLGIPFHYKIFSQMHLSLGSVEAAGDWGLRISEALGATEYINPPGGAHLYDPVRFAQSGIKLTIQEPVDFTYDCGAFEFQPSLSIIDVMMWNSPAAIRRYLASRCSDDKRGS